jgi:hypothetical protein
MPELQGGALDQAASLLLAVGCADPFGTDRGARLRCLWAVEQLRSVGARPDRVLDPITDDAVAGILGAALTALGSPQPSLAGDPPVVDAIAAARAALKSTG